MASPARLSALGLVFGLIIAGLTLQLSGNAPEPMAPGIPDPGVLVGWLLVASRLITNLAALVTIGLLVLAVFLMPSGEQLEGLAVRAVRFAAWFGFVWALAAVVLLIANVSDVFARPLGTLTPTLVWSFVTDSTPGRSLALQAVGALIVALVCYWTLNIRALAVVFGLALASVGVVALAGHAASAGSHTLAVISQLLHTIPVMIWVGGLFALGWVALHGSKRFPEAVSRYSVIALWCFVTVGVAGFAAATVRFGSLSDLNSTYGFLVIAKVLLFVALGIVGFRQRRAIAAGSGGFVRLLLVESAIMIAAIAFAVVLSRTPTPLGDDVLQTPAERLLGTTIPPEPSVWNLLFGWSANGLGLAIVGFGLAFYLVGVRTLHRRGDRWPVSRTISWCIGILFVGWATFGGLGEYSHVMFSVHMGSHMALSMIAPIFLVLAAPTTLALRTLPGPRRPGEQSPRTLLLAMLHSRVSRFFTHPVVAATIFVGSLYGLYFSNLLEYLMLTHSGHLLMEAHFLLSGFLFYYVVIGVDPSPRQLPPLLRFGLMMVTIPFHAFFSVILMGSTQIMAENYYVLLDRPYATDLLQDQYVGGGVAWAMGEVPLLLVTGALFVQWIRTDAREARRTDRASDRDDDAELNRYNEYLKRLNENSMDSQQS